MARRRLWARLRRLEEGDGPDRWAPPVGDPGERREAGGRAGPRPAAGPAERRGKKGKWADGPFHKKEEKEGKKKKKKKKDFSLEFKILLAQF